MANCNKLFKDFNVALNVTVSKKERLKKSKEDLRERIRKDFVKNHPDYKPSFYMQGSFKLGTTIRTKEDECDIDDGIYFLKIPYVNGTTIQSWIKNAVTGSTSETPEHKSKCIRVYYKGDYHIDLPVYYKIDNDLHPHLAVKNEEWELSDPKEFIDWFNTKKWDQLLRVIKYLKAWGDHKRTKMPNGLIMTVWAEKYLKQNSERDDVALLDTLKEMQKNLKVVFSCVMPTTPFDNLVASYDQTRIDIFLDNLDAFIKDAEAAIIEKNQLKSSKLWQKHLGMYFPDGANEDVEAKEAALRIKTATVLGGTAYTSPSGVINSSDGVMNLPHRNYGS